MESKKRMLLLTTGGTIACVAGEDGLEPQKSSVVVLTKLMWALGQGMTQGEIAKVFETN